MVSSIIQDVIPEEEFLNDKDSVNLSKTEKFIITKELNNLLPYKNLTTKHVNKKEQIFDSLKPITTKNFNKNSIIFLEENSDDENELNKKECLNINQLIEKTNSNEESLKSASKKSSKEFKFDKSIDLNLHLEDRFSTLQPKGQQSIQEKLKSKIQNINKINKNLLVKNNKFSLLHKWEFPKSFYFTLWKVNSLGKETAYRKFSSNMTTPIVKALNEDFGSIDTLAYNKTLIQDHQKSKSLFNSSNNLLSDTKKKTKRENILGYSSNLNQKNSIFKKLNFNSLNNSKQPKNKHNSLNNSNNKTNTQNLISLKNIIHNIDKRKQKKTGFYTKQNSLNFDGLKNEFVSNLHTIENEVEEDKKIDNDVEKLQFSSNSFYSHLTK